MFYFFKLSKTCKLLFNEDDVYYYRFITHLKFFAKRLIEQKTYQDEESDDLLDVIKKKYQNAYRCVEKIGQFIDRKYEYQLSKEELLYLTIHIERVINRTQG
ncbi:MAG: PRD domain-containing protein [Lachnospiraceae bacterium]|nr:PRD domain-containing protein [Lachnospiraceae bacterium]